MPPLGGSVRVTWRQTCPIHPLVLRVFRVRRHPKGPGKSTEVVRRPVLLRVYLGPLPPPVVMDQDRLLMFSRTPGRIRKLLRKVSGTSVSLV